MIITILIYMPLFGVLKDISQYKKATTTKQKNSMENWLRYLFNIVSDLKFVLFLFAHFDAIFSGQFNCKIIL